MLHADEKSQSSGVTPVSGNVVALELFDGSIGPLRNANGGVGWKRPWITPRAAIPEIIEVTASTSNTPDAVSRRGLSISGTGIRNNPLRRELASPLTQKEVFVRFELRYQSDEAVDPSVVDPEFFVLWLDRLDGGDRSTHASNVPNIGVHIADRGPKKGRNVFMVRVGPAHTAWSKVELEYNRT